jgi:hypothetical protein
MNQVGDDSQGDRQLEQVEDETLHGNRGEVMC